MFYISSNVVLTEQPDTNSINHIKHTNHISNNSKNMYSLIYAPTSVRKPMTHGPFHSAQESQVVVARILKKKKKQQSTKPCVQCGDCGANLRDPAKVGREGNV